MSRDDTVELRVTVTELHKLCCCYLYQFSVSFNMTCHIDLIFTNQPNLVIINSGVHRVLHQNCHHQIILAQINLKVYYPPLYKQLVLDDKKANIDAINLAIKFFNWENAFNGKDINSQVKLFNETLMKNIFSNFIPNKIKTFRSSDPSWMNEDKVKNKAKLKHKLHHRYLRHKRNNEDFAKLEYLRSEIDNLIPKSKKKFYQNINRKLNDPPTSCKTYCSIMKTFFNGKKVPVIPPYLTVHLSLTFGKKQIFSIPFFQINIH